MAASAPQVEIVPGVSAIAELAGAWQDMARRGIPVGLYEQFPLVMIAAEAAEASGSEPVAVVVRGAGGGVRTILPLRLTRPLGSRVAQALTAPLGQYCDVVGEPLDPETLDAVCRELRASLALDVLILRKVRRDGGLAAALARSGVPQNEATSAPFIDLKAFAGFDAYNATFAAATRRNRRQRRQKLEAKHGPLTFKQIRGFGALAMLDLALRWKSEWLSARGLKSAVIDHGPWQQALRRTVGLEQAVTFVLYAGSMPAAIEHGFVSGSEYSSYLGAFDPELAHFSVGQEQMLRTIAWAFDLGLERYDLLAPGDEYKLQWTRSPTGVPVEDYAVPLTALGRGMAEVRRHARPAAKSLVLNMRPEVRVVGGKLAGPAAIAAMALGIAALTAE